MLGAGGLQTDAPEKRDPKNPVVKVESIDNGAGGTAYAVTCPHCGRYHTVHEAKSFPCSCSKTLAIS